MPIEKKCSLNYGRQIVILQRGWVIVGKMTRTGNDCEVTEGAVIRRWGTSEARSYRMALIDIKKRIESVLE